MLAAIFEVDAGDVVFVPGFSIVVSNFWLVVDVVVGHDDVNLSFILVLLNANGSIMCDVEAGVNSIDRLSGDDAEVESTLTIVRFRGGLNVPFRWAQMFALWRLHISVLFFDSNVNRS